MSLIRTYIDAGVLIQAARGVNGLARKAIGILDDSEREFVSSILVKLETLPKAIYEQKNPETDFYNKFFERVVAWSSNHDALLQQALDLAKNFGLSAMDALHVSAAISLKTDQFVTTESPCKPIHRVAQCKTLSIHPLL